MTAEQQPTEHVQMFEDNIPPLSGSKPPRKLRPSEIATKKVKAAKAKKKTKPKAKKKTVRKTAKKTAKRKPAKKASKPAAGGVVRSERLDFRLSKAEKAKVHAKAKKLRRTITSIVLEAIEKVK